LAWKGAVVLATTILAAAGGEGVDRIVKVALGANAAFDE
jgi:hypothetical protein